MFHYHLITALVPSYHLEASCAMSVTTKINKNVHNILERLKTSGRLTLYQHNISQVLKK